MVTASVEVWAGVIPPRRTMRPSESGAKAGSITGAGRCPREAVVTARSTGAVDVAWRCVVVCELVLWVWLPPPPQAETSSALTRGQAAVRATEMAPKGTKAFGPAG